MEQAQSFMFLGCKLAH